MTFKTMFKIGERVVFKKERYTISRVSITVSTTRKDIDYALQGSEFAGPPEEYDCWASEHELRQSN